MPRSIHEVLNETKCSGFEIASNVPNRKFVKEDIEEFATAFSNNHSVKSLSITIPFQAGCMPSFIKALEKNVAVKQLVFKGPIGSLYDFQCLAVFLATNKSITHLHLSDTQLTSAAIGILTHYLKDNDALQVLELINILHFSTLTATTVRSLKQLFQIDNLHTLNLSSNRIETAHLKILAPCIEQSKLKCLILDNNKITVEAAPLFFSMLKNKYLYQLSVEGAQSSNLCKPLIQECIAFKPEEHQAVTILWQMLQSKKRVRDAELFVNACKRFAHGP
jgi:hypothetical protein